ncbi:MAG: hypothetical protein ACI82A_003838 [Candidatus Azotimanducaceae bacterium]|jgi:hypothetical protein
MDRRYFLKTATALGGMSLVNPTLADPIAAGLLASDLVYLSPIKSNGKVSACQAEIWFAYDGANIYVCTGSESWRATAPTLGLAMTRIWVGDLGQWQNTDGQYKNLPSIVAKASVESSQQEQARVLELFGEKYRVSWLVWGRRFRKGLADGSRTMLKYQPVA